MGDKYDVNIVSEVEVIDIISQTDENFKEGGDKVVSSTHKDNTQWELMYYTVQTNEKRDTPTKEQPKPIIELEDVQPNHRAR